MPFQGTEQIKDRHGGNNRIGNGVHITFGQGACRYKAEKASVLMDDRKAGDSVSDDFTGSVHSHKFKEFVKVCKACRTKQYVLCIFIGILQVSCLKMSDCLSVLYAELEGLAIAEGMRC